MQNSQNSLLRGISILLISAVSLQAFATSVPTGIMYVSGSVQVNGKNVNSATAVFPGDSVQTDSTTAATIASKGMRITLATKTGLSFANDSVILSCGNAAFQSSAATPVKVGRFSVSPSARNAHFQVVNRDGLVKIAALEGGINIFDGKQTLSLAAGKMFTVPSENCIAFQDSNSQSTQDKNKDRKTSKNSKSNSGNGSAGGISSGAVTGIVLVSAAAIGITAAVVTAENNNKTPVSPSVP